jgi:cytochrome c peroxidase
MIDQFRFKALAVASPLAWIVCGGLLASCGAVHPLDPDVSGPGDIEGTMAPLFGATDRAKVASLHSPAATHCTMAQLLSAPNRFDAAFACGNNHFQTFFNAVDGVGANVGNSTRFTRTPRADKQGTSPAEWFNHVPARATGPNAQSCNSCHNQGGDDGGGGASENVHRDPQRTGNLQFMIQRNTPHLFGIGAIQRLAEEMTAQIKAQAAAGQPLSSKGVSFGTASAPQGIDADLVVKPLQWKGSVAFIRDFVRGAAHNEIGMQGVELVGDNVDGDGDGVANEFGIGDITALSAYQGGQLRPTTKIELNSLGLLTPALTAAEIAQINAGEVVFNSASLGCVSCHKPSMTLNDAMFSEPSQSPFYRDATFPSGVSPLSKSVDPANAIRFDLTRDIPDNPFPLNGSTLGNFEKSGTNGAIVRLFGDLKRHFMGGAILSAGRTSGLAEQISESEPGVFTGNGPATFLTENLWGVGTTPPYLHDGRASTITEAVLEHGGEAAASRDAYRALSTTDAQAVIAFLNNLVLFKVEPGE